eukprot:NODE_977_length_2811_cov_0.444322.p1 type:complete len:265 gc:universal NODE_977_length_2811_cov_0.444322:1970-1176(-)
MKFGSLAAFLSFLPHKEPSKCAKTDQLTHEYNRSYDKQKIQYQLQLFQCEINALTLQKHGVEARIGLLSASQVSEIKSYLENSDIITIKDRHRLHDYQFLATDTELYIMAEKWYETLFKIKVKCMDAKYRPKSKKATIFFHTDMRVIDRQYRRLGFDDEKHNYQAAFAKNQLFNVWINLSHQPVKNYPLGFILNNKKQLSEPVQNDHRLLAGGAYNAYYYKDMPSGSVLFFKSSQIAHGAIKLNDDPTERTTLELRCINVDQHQ